MPAQLGAWKQKIVAFAGSLGAPGLFLISFLDSSVLTFPVINDLLLIDLSVRQPARMPLYASMAALGSLLGCVFLFLLARTVEEAAFHQKVGARAGAIRHWVERNGFGGMLVAAMPFATMVSAKYVGLPMVDPIPTSPSVRCKACRHKARPNVAPDYGGSKPTSTTIELNIERLAKTTNGFAVK